MFSGQIQMIVFTNVEYKRCYNSAYKFPYFWETKDNCTNNILKFVVKLIILKIFYFLTFYVSVILLSYLNYYSERRGIKPKLQMLKGFINQAKLAMHQIKIKKLGR